MKLSNKPRHKAPHKSVLNNKNSPGHRSLGGRKEASRSNLAAEMIKLLFSKMSRRTRRVFIEQERTINVRNKKQD